MSAMKMDFICDPEDQASKSVVPTSASATSSSSAPTSEGKINALYNNEPVAAASPEAEPTAKKPRLEVTLTRPPHGGFQASSRPPSEATDGERQVLGDDEAEEDDHLEHAPWQDVDVNPATELVSKVVRESIDAAKTYNKSIANKTTQLISGCDNVILELKNLAETREAARRDGKPSAATHEQGCTCALALSMLPITDETKEQVDKLTKASSSSKEEASAASLDSSTEDQTDRVLTKISASLERLRELGEMVQATSLQGEANVISKVMLEENALVNLSNEIASSAAAATATAIAQERGPNTSAYSKLYSPLQLKKLEEWYQKYPRPLLDELTLMKTILNYRPYFNEFRAEGLTIQNVRDWFDQRRAREKMRYVKLAVESGREAGAAEEEIEFRLQKRVDRLRVTLDPNDLVKQLELARAQSLRYDGSVGAFTRPGQIKSYVVNSHEVDLPTGENATAIIGSKRPRAYQDGEVTVVKEASREEVTVLQNRIRSLLMQQGGSRITAGLQQVVHVLRAMDISSSVRLETGITDDLNEILRLYKKPPALRQSTNALLSRLGAPGKKEEEDESVKEEATPPSSPIDVNKKKGRRTHRPMKFSMQQLQALEKWFQQKYKPSAPEMERYLSELNSPPLRDVQTQVMDVSMTQLRRWFNKRRCLGRPPLALLSQQEADAAREGKVETATEDTLVQAPEEEEGRQRREQEERAESAADEVRQRTLAGSGDDGDSDDDDESSDDDPSSEDE